MQERTDDFRSFTEKNDSLWCTEHPKHCTVSVSAQQYLLPLQRQANMWCCSIHHGAHKKNPLSISATGSYLWNEVISDWITLSSDVWLTVHRNSVWIRKTNYMSLFVFFISLLIVAQHVLGNHVPIIRSWRLRDVIVLCWYVPWLQGGCQVFCILYFSSNSCSTCFRQPCAHHQELTTAWC